MTDNIFLISDASYSHETRTAGFSVANLHTGRIHTKSEVMSNGTSGNAEYKALLYSVYIALINQYDNVVFVYDCKGLNTSGIHTYLIGKIEHYQFLWLKRNYVDRVDSAAKQARRLKEKLMVTSHPKTRLRGIGYNLVGKQLLLAFKEKRSANILRSSFVIANDLERTCLRHYLTNNDNASEINFQMNAEELNYRFFNLVYNLIKPEEQVKFYKYLNDITAGEVSKTKLSKQKKENFYIKQVEAILQRLKEIKI